MSLWQTTLNRLGIGSRNGAEAKGIASLPLPNRASQGQYADWRNFLASFMAQVQPITPSEARDGRDNSVVAIALNWIATSWEVAVPQVGRLDATGVFLPLPKHPLLDLLETPAKDMDGATLRSALISELVRKGNAYAHVVTTRAGVPVGLEYLPTRYVKPVPSPETGRLSHYEYSPNGTRFDLQPYEILHLRTGVNEDFPLEGVSLLAAQYREIVTDNSYSDFAGGLSKNGSIPPLMFTPRQTPDGMMAMTGDEAAQLSDTLNEKMRQEPGRPRVLPGSLEMHKMGLSPNEMALTDVRAMPETRIPAALGLPSVLLQLYTGIQKSTYNNLAEAIKQGWRGCMIPLMQIVAKAITRQLLPLFPNSAGLVFRWDVSGVPELIDDGLDNRKADREDVAAGILTVDEARERQGLAALPAPAPVPSADTLPSPSSKAWQARTVKVSSTTTGDTSDLYAAADKFRRALAGDDADAMNVLGKEWEKTRRALTRRSQSLLDFIAEQEASGVDPSEWRAEAAARLAKLTEQIDAELSSLSDRSAAVVEDAQRAAIGTASAHVSGLATAAAGTPPPGVSLSFSTLPSDAFEALVGFASDGSPLSTLLATFGTESAQLIRSSLLEGIAAGDSPRQVAARLAMATNVSRARLENICRTEMLRANREACRRTYVANNDVVSGFERLSAADSRTCIACWALHGTRQELGQVMPSHPQCLLPGTMVQSPEILASTNRWYTGEALDIRVKSGEILSVTPNHPILTPDGWIAAGLLKEGGYVVRCLDGKSALSGVHPHNDGVPSLIEDVVKSFGRSGSMTASAVEVSPEDFHGDGAGSEVCIVGADSLLRDALNAAMKQPLTKQGFSGRSSEGESLSGEGQLDFSVHAPGNSANSGMGGGAVPGVLLRCPKCHHGTVRFGLPTALDSVLGEDSGNYVTGHADTGSDDILAVSGEITSADALIVNRVNSIIPQGVAFPEQLIDSVLADSDNGRTLLDSLAGQVEFDCIVSIGRREYSGHVYNLQTTEGWYVANSIITHNCRCVAVPVLKSWAEITGDPTLPDTRDDMVSGPDLFGMLPEDSQAEILGPARFDLYRAGVSLGDMVETPTNAQWGPETRIKPLSEVSA